MSNQPNTSEKPKEPKFDKSSLDQSIKDKDKAIKTQQIVKK